MLLSENLIKIMNEKYYLFNYQGDEELEEAASAVEEVMKECKKEGRTLIRIEEIADRIGRPPESIRKEAYKLGPKYGVKIYYDNYVIPVDHKNIF